METVNSAAGQHLRADSIRAAAPVVSARLFSRRLFWIRITTSLLSVLLMPTYASMGQSVVINELMAANDRTIADPDYGEFGDWVEIHNAGTVAIDLGGYHLSDDPAQPLRWRMPDGTTVAAGGHLLVWADGRGVGLHANFRLSRGGEFVGLYDAAGLQVDEIRFGVQEADASYGRAPDGSPDWRYFTEPTPGSSNNAAGYLGIAPAPTSSHSAGLYSSGINVSLSTSLPGAIVRFTTDGSPPTESSTLYADPIDVSKSTVVRAVVYREGYADGPTATYTYLIGESTTLPLVSLSTHPDNFFSDESGIYVEGTNGIEGYCRSIPLNWNQDWERPVHIEFFEPDGRLGFAMDAGVKIFGGCTRIYPQKSLAIYARRLYGPAKIDYRLFPDRDIDSFNNLVLRSSAQDWWRTMFRDGMIHTVIEQGMSLETQAYRPAIVFLNGEYWGIHNMREKQNAHYLESHFGADPDNVEILTGDKADPIGQSSHYERMISFILNADLQPTETLEAIDQWMDVDSYVDYLIAEIYSANADWPGNNLKLWRPATADGRWRWMIFDMDFGFGGNAEGQYFSNTLALATDPNGSEWPNPPWSTLLTRKLLENPGFRHEFIQRFAAHINTTFATDHVIQTIDSLAANIAAEIPRHKARWPQSISFGNSWEELTEIMREFARQRPVRVRGHLADHFGLSGSTRLNVSVSNAEGGWIEAHGVRMPGPAFGAIFFRDVPVRLRAVAAPGYRFLRWEGAVESVSDTVALTLDAESDLVAVFESDEGATSTNDDSPVRNRLHQNYPNPFKSRTRIDFELARPSPTTIRVFDVLGRVVAVLRDQRVVSGRRSIQLDVSGLPSGIYFYELRSGEYVSTRSMVVLP